MSGRSVENNYFLLTEHLVKSKGQESCGTSDTAISWSHGMEKWVSYLIQNDQLMWMVDVIIPARSTRCGPCLLASWKLAVLCMWLYVKLTNVAALWTNSWTAFCCIVNTLPVISLELPVYYAVSLHSYAMDHAVIITVIITYSYFVTLCTRYSIFTRAIFAFIRNQK